jgi:hypothetical protein
MIPPIAVAVVRFAGPGARGGRRRAAAAVAAPLAAPAA